MFYEKLKDLLGEAFLPTKPMHSVAVAVRNAYLDATGHPKFDEDSGLDALEDFISKVGDDYLPYFQNLCACYVGRYASEFDDNENIDICIGEGVSLPMHVAFLVPKIAIVMDCVAQVVAASKRMDVASAEVAIDNIEVVHDLLRQEPAALSTVDMESRCGKFVQYLDAEVKKVKTEVVVALIHLVAGHVTASGKLLQQMPIEEHCHALATLTDKKKELLFAITKTDAAKTFKDHWQTLVQFVSPKGFASRLGLTGTDLEKRLPPMYTNVKETAAAILGVQALCRPVRGAQDR